MQPTCSWWRVYQVSKSTKKSMELMYFAGCNVIAPEFHLGILPSNHPWSRATRNTPFIASPLSSAIEKTPQSNSIQFHIKQLPLSPHLKMCTDRHHHSRPPLPDPSLHNKAIRALLNQWSLNNRYFSHCNNMGLLLLKSPYWSNHRRRCISKPVDFGVRWLLSSL